MNIGNKNHISFELDGSESSPQLENLNFYLGNKLISNESVYTPTYIASLERFLELLNTRNFHNSKMQGLTSEQRVEVLMEERNTDESQFFKHLFQLNETIDRYSIFVFQTDKLTDFIWSCWDEHNCNSDHEQNQIYSTQMSTVELTATLNQLNDELKRRLANIR